MCIKNPKKTLLFLDNGLNFFWGDRMANLGPINFKLGLYIKVNVNDGQKNLKFISQNIWPKWPSIGTK